MECLSAGFKLVSNCMLCSCEAYVSSDFEAERQLQIAMFAVRQEYEISFVGLQTSSRGNRCYVLFIFLHSFSLLIVSNLYDLTAWIHSLAEGSSIQPSLTVNEFYDKCQEPRPELLCRFHEGRFWALS